MDRIILVDDDRGLRATIGEILAGEGFMIEEAGDVEEALAAMNPAPDLALVDMVLPGMDGLAAIPLLRRQAPRLRIIVMTAYASVTNAVQALKQGADDYLAKPFRMDELLTAVRKQLQHSRFRDATLDLDAVFHALANPMRRAIVLILRDRRGRRFMELVRELGAGDHTKVNFHLKVLREAGFLCRGRERVYALTAAGERAAAMITAMADDLDR